VSRSQAADANRQVGRALQAKGLPNQTCLLRILLSMSCEIEHYPDDGSNENNKRTHHNESPIYRFLS